MDRTEMLERVQASILEDIHNAVVPASVERFAELHDHVDANEYFQADDGSMLGTLDDCNAIMAEVDAWLASRRGAVVPKGYAGDYTVTDQPCPYCERLGRKTNGGYTPCLRRDQQGRLVCMGSHGVVQL